MVEIVYNDTPFSCADVETVLDTLFRHKADIPYSCRKGTCLTCLVKARDGDVPEQAQKNIRPALAGQGYFLACQCPSAAGLSITSGDDAVLYRRATVQRVDKMAPDICRVTFRSSTPLYYRAGRADVAAFVDNPDLSGWRAFICGYPAMVREARKTALMAGIPIPHIHADPFDFMDLRSAEREGERARPDGW
jgi:ferredoxin